jgi:hypothetical protein
VDAIVARSAQGDGTFENGLAHLAFLLRFNPVVTPHGAKQSKASVWLLMALCCVSAGVAMTFGHGFTVDDALISTRVAYHLRVNHLYAFNPDGPVVDCVTPLGWAWLLAPFSAPGPWQGFEAARILGIASGLASAGFLAALLYDRHSRLRWPSLVGVCFVLATNLPFGAWASSGMETSFVTALCTAGVWGLVRHRGFGPLAVGAAAALRPELIPWGLTVSLLTPLPESSRPDSATDVSVATSPRAQWVSRGMRVSLTILPVLVVVVTRIAVFGSPAPLAVLAKPSDGSHGLSYVGGALRLLGAPVLLVGWGVWRHVSPAGRAAAVAFVVHTIAVLGVGGDWMSLFRLFVPILPVSLWVGSLVIQEQHPWVTGAKLLIAGGINCLMLWSLGPASRQVVDARRTLIAAAVPHLAESRHIASLDVGWVGAAVTAPITDLAGVTDPEIARLPGGHTSKRLPRNLFERRDVDTLVVLLAPHQTPLPSTPLHELHPARVVENSLARLEGAEEFRVTATVPLHGTSQHYAILKRHSGD